MRRCRTVTLVALFAGAAVNVLVAWAIAARAEHPPAVVGLTVVADGIGPPSPRRTTRSSTRGITGTFVALDESQDTLSIEWRVGWPLRSMVWRTTASRPSTRQTRSFRPSGSLWADGLGVPEWLARPHSSREWRRFPLAPLGVGFAANTACYSTSIAAALLGAGWFRWRCRCRRAQCVRCGYALAGLGAAAVCPECGRAGG